MQFWALAITLFLLDAGIDSIHAMGTNGAPGSLRPFYIIGHGANTLDVAKQYLISGANGIECDVDTLAGHPDTLRIGHGPLLGTGPVGTNAVPLKDFLKGLHELARVNTNFCLVYFDCKSLAARPELGRNILDDIRIYLVGQGTDSIPLNAIISVGTLEDKAIFANIADDLGPHEGIMVDGVSRPGEVFNFFDSTKALNRCFSDGTVPFNSLMAHFEIFWAVKKACHMRNRDHKFCFVGTWTCNNPWLMKTFIKMGVDGILVDRKFTWYNFSWVNLGNGLGSMKHIVKHDGTNLHIRLANRQDDPFLIRR